MTDTPNDLMNRPVHADLYKRKNKPGILTSKTDLNGIIEYANNDFIEQSGYEDYELIARPHSIIRHPDMPKVIFKMLWDHLQAGNTFRALVKNKTKSGEAYWLMADFESSRNEAGEIIQYFSSSKVYAAPIIQQVNSLYKNLVTIEEVGDVEESEKYLAFFLNVIEKTYTQYINTI